MGYQTVLPFKREGKTGKPIKEFVGSVGMASKGRGRLINRPTKTGEKEYDKFFIYLPTELVRDSAFPFKPGDYLLVEIDQKKKELRMRKFDSTG